jgi:hypothetical protein
VIIIGGARSPRRGSPRVRFTDAEGIVWTISFERRLDHVVSISREHRADRGMQEWLYFRSARGVKRLSDFPAEWQAFSPTDLDGLCKRALPVKE